MAHFISGCSGKAKTTVTRLGSKSSGACAYARGWNVGGSVSVQWVDDTDTDIVTFRVNRGSNNSAGYHLITLSCEQLDKFISGRASIIFKELK